MRVTVFLLTALGVAGCGDGEWTPPAARHAVTTFSRTSTEPPTEETTSETRSTPTPPVVAETPTPSPTPTPTPALPCVPLSSLPRVLTNPCYRVTKNLTITNPTWPAIRFAYGNIDLDLNGYEIACVGCGSSLNQIGVAAHGKKNITVHDGRIRGFTIGVRLDDNGYDRIAIDSTAAVANILVDSVEVVDSTFRGIRLEARDSAVTNCTVRNTGPGSADGTLVMGIESYGPRPQLTNNTVLETRAPAGGEGVGISISDWGNGAQVLGNVATVEEAGAGADYGIWIGGDSDDVVVAGNMISNFNYGITFSSPTSGEYHDNDVQGATVPYAINSENVSGDPPP